MIDTQYRIGEIGTKRDEESLQQYVRALLSRQQALDLLESIQHQINEVWAVMRRLLDYTGPAATATKAIRVARAAQAAKAQDSYRCLEKRREECIAALQHAERVASAALQAVVASSRAPRITRKKSLSLASRARFKAQKLGRAGRRKAAKVKKVLFGEGLNPTAGIADAFIGN